MTANVAPSRIVAIDTTRAPYNNDWDESKNFHQILFRPGRAVQNRELIQLQTILQNQTERFGSHIFENGSLVIGSGVSLTQMTTLNVASTYANADVTPSNFDNKTIQYPSANNDVVARVILTSAATNTDPIGLHVKYTTGSEFGDSTTVKVVSEEVYANLANANSASTGLMAFIDDSIYYYNGYFIKVPRQAIVIDKYLSASNTSYRVGLEMDDSIVTSVSDTSLLDPAQGDSYQSPSADRYKIELVLAKRDLTSIDDSKFIELVRVENGTLKKQVKRSVYSEIEKEFARRTYDESGNYTVDPFLLAIDDANTTHLNFKLSPGKAYIYGYEYETIADTVIPVPKARTQAQENNYALNMNYGNYVIVNELKGFFDIESQEIVDIHSVPYQYVNHANTATYNATRIGTCRISQLDFYDNTSVDPDGRQFQFHINDVKFNKILPGANNSANTAYVQFMNANTSSNNDAYNGAIVRVLSGSSLGDVRTISDYDGTTKTAFVATPFSSSIQNTDAISLEFNFKQAESFVKHTAYTLGASANANTNITTLSKSAGLSNGDVVISEPTRQSLVFAYPNFFLANNITDELYSYTEVYTGVQFTDGVSAQISAGTDNQFLGASATSNTATTVVDNFIVIVANPQSSGRTAGEQVPVNATVTAGTPEQASFDTDQGGGDTFTAYVYAKIQKTNNTQRTKTLNLANTTNFATEASANTITSNTGATIDVYLSTGQVLIQNPTKEQGKSESLYISDIQAIVKIWDLEGANVPSANASLTSYKDVTSYYDFDNGQRDTYYDHGKIRLKSGRSVTGPLVVCTRYYRTTAGEYGYFSVDSYPNLFSTVTEEGVNLGTGYSLIPDYNNRNLRDCIDFRPKRKNADPTPINFELQGIRIPIPTTDFISDYNYFLGRRDLVVLTGNREIEVIQGLPDKYPQNPRKPARSMVLYKAYIPPYTIRSNSVKINYIDNKRYTMRDIGLLDKRLQRVEYYTYLNLLEKNAIDINITDADGLARTKQGVVAEDFASHGLGAVTRSDYKCDIEKFSTTLIPRSIPKVHKLVVESGTETNVTTREDKITLSYTEEAFIEQDGATKFTPVADFLFASFEGQIFTVPEADIWKSNRVVEDYNITTSFSESGSATENVTWLYVPRGENMRTTMARMQVLGLKFDENGSIVKDENSNINIEQGNLNAAWWEVMRTGRYGGASMDDFLEPQPSNDFERGGN